MIAAFNDRKHANRVTLLTAHESQTTTETASSAVAEDALWRQGDDIGELSFISSVNGWAMTRLGGLLLTLDGGKTWKDISPVVTPTPR